MPGAEVAGRKTPEPETHGEIHLMYFLFDCYFLHRVSGSISRDRSRRVVPPLAMQPARGFAPSISVCYSLVQSIKRADDIVVLVTCGSL